MRVVIADDKSTIFYAGVSMSSKGHIERITQSGNLSRGQNGFDIYDRI